MEPSPSTDFGKTGSVQHEGISFFRQEISLSCWEMAISRQVVVAGTEGPQRDLVTLTGALKKPSLCPKALGVFHWLVLRGSETPGFGWGRAAPFLWDFLPSGIGNLTRNPALMRFPA